MDNIRETTAHSSDYAEATQEPRNLPEPTQAVPDVGTLPRRSVLRLAGVIAAVSLVGVPVVNEESAAAARKRKRGKRVGREGRGGQEGDRGHGKDDEHGGGHGQDDGNDNGLGWHGGGNGGGNGQGSGAATVLFQDDFRSGFNGTGPDWTYFSAPGFTGNDGEETTSSHGLRVSAPQFASTVPMETGPTSLPGGFDHVKWLAYVNHLNGAVPGFAAEPGSELAVTARFSARTYGTANHPFGNAVTDPDADGRLAAAALNGADFESWMVFDHFLTNKRIYAVYERLPFGRAQLGNYASFTFMVPLVDRRPEDEHELSVVYDRSAGTVRWLVSGKEKFRVDRLGHLIDRKYMTLDHGGVEEDVEPKQLNFGMGLFTLLDARLPSGKALVRLSNVPDFYFDPEEGEPAPQTFEDETSADGSRLFGQGAEMQVRQYIVQSKRIRQGK